jgi:hypothetical protein
MTFEEKHEAITKLSDRLDNALEGSEISVAMVAFIEIVAAQLIGHAEEAGEGREWYEECVDGVREDLMALWDVIHPKGRSIN